VEDVGEPVDEVLHESGDGEAVDRGGEDHTVGVVHLLLDVGGVVPDGTALLAPFEARMAPPAGFKFDVPEHEVFELDVAEGPHHVLDPLRRPVGVALPGASHDNQNLHAQGLRAFSGAGCWRRFCCAIR